MAKIFGLGASKSDDNNEEELKNAQRVQDYVNRFKIRSRDLKTLKNKKEETQTSTAWQSYAWIEESTTTYENRVNRYNDYKEMCKVPEMNHGLNIYADNATQYNVSNNVLDIESDNAKVIEILEELFFEKLDINANLWNYTKNMCKLGDEFLEVIPDNKKNPHHIVSLERVKKPESMKRIEKKSQVQKFIYEAEAKEGQEVKSKTFLPWQITHFRIEDDEYAPYGRSIFESGRRTWKRLSLMEDAMLVYRISRAPERRVFYVDVGTLSTKEANSYLEQLKRKFRKRTFVNPSTGEIDEKANPLSVDEDFFIGVRENSQGTRIDTLPGGSALGEIDDVKYFKDQILKTLGIPSGYTGGAEAGGGYDPKAFLSQQDIQFSRTIERIQKFVVKGLEKIALIELVFQRVDEEQLNNFKIKLTPPSNVDQLMDIEIRTQQMNLISQMKTIENFIPDDWIYKNILGFSEKEINKIKLQIQMQMQMAAQMAATFGEGGTGAGGGAPMMGGGNIAPAMAGGPPEADAMPPKGGEAPDTMGGEGGESSGPAGLEVAGRSFVEFDGGNWLMENVADAKKLLKYLNLYEKVHKDNSTNKYEHQNGITRMAIKGEFRGLLTANRCLQSNKITLSEDTKFKTTRDKYILAESKDSEK